MRAENAASQSADACCLSKLRPSSCTPASVGLGPGALLPKMACSGVLSLLRLACMLPRGHPRGLHRGVKCGTRRTLQPTLHHNSCTYLLKRGTPRMPRRPSMFEMMLMNFKYCPSTNQWLTSLTERAVTRSQSQSLSEWYQTPLLINLHFRETTSYSKVISCGAISPIT